MSNRLPDPTDSATKERPEYVRLAANVIANRFGGDADEWAAERVASTLQRAEERRREATTKRRVLEDREVAARRRGNAMQQLGGNPLGVPDGDLVRELDRVFGHTRPDQWIDEAPPPAQWHRWNAVQESRALDAYRLAGRSVIEFQGHNRPVLVQEQWIESGRWAEGNPLDALSAITWPKYRAAVKRAAYPRGRDMGSRSRAIVALGYLVWLVGRQTSRRGFALVAAGIPAGAWGRMIPSPDGGSYHRNSIKARRHTGKPGAPGTAGRRGGLAGDYREGHCGFMEALRQAGAVLAYQPSLEALPAWQCGPSGFPALQVWIAADMAEPEEPAPDPRPPD